MATGKKLTLHTDGVQLAPGVEIALADILAWAPVDSNARGIVLANERFKALIEIDGKAVEHVITLYAQRAPLDEAESEAVAKVAATRAEAKATKEQAELAKREREVKRAYELGQEGMTHALKNINTLASAVGTLNKLNG